MPATAVDTTGAGDSFCGAFVASYVRNPNDIVGAAQAGIVAASFAVEEFGIAGLLAATKAKVASRLRELQSLPCN